MNTPLEVLHEIQATTRSNLPDVEFVPMYYTYDQSVMAVIDIFYFVNRARDFYSVTSIFFSHGNAANRITAVPPNLGVDFTSATLAAVTLTLATAKDAEISSLWYGRHHI